MKLAVMIQSTLVSTSLYPFTSPHLFSTLNVLYFITHSLFLPSKASRGLCDGIRSSFIHFHGP